MLFILCLFIFDQLLDHLVQKILPHIFEFFDVLVFSTSRMINSCIESGIATVQVRLQAEVFFEEGFECSVVGPGKVFRVLSSSVKSIWTFFAQLLISLFSGFSLAIGCFGIESPMKILAMN